MSVVRIDEVRAAANRQDDLRVALAEILAAVRTADGCDSVQVFQSATEPERIVVVERWRDRDSHQTAMASVRPAALHRVMALLAEMPEGEYYAQVEAGA